MTIKERTIVARRPSVDGWTNLQLPAARVRRWQRLFARLLSITDTFVIAIAVFGAQLVRIGFGEKLVIAGVPDENVAVAYTFVSIVMVLAWALSLRLFGTRDYKIIGTGVVEYKRVTNATFAVFGLFAIVAFALQAPIGRSYLLVALPAGWVLLVLSRWMWRAWLIDRRRHGRLLSHAVLVGDRASSLHVAQQIQRDPGCGGLKIVGAVTEQGRTQVALADDIPVIGDWYHLLDHVDTVRADTVIITGSHTLTPRELRELGWGLEERKASLIVAPALTDVAGPRIHSTPVAGLPLIHVDYPEFTGIHRFLKRGSDLVGALILILITSPIMITVAVAVKATSRGPILYGQERVGRDGVPFKMWKFRSMIVGADDHLRSLLDAQGTSDRPLFKVANDPRITSVGRFIRRYSLDELPQLFNVFTGTMSLVGPRPQVAAEVALYEGGARRRLLMRPGISGLWQVSGRSDLAWDDAIRLDLYYVENWSLTGDLVILWRTVRAVLGTDGAY